MINKQSDDTNVGLNSNFIKLGVSGKYTKEEFQSDCNKSLDDLKKEREDYKQCMQTVQKNNSFKEDCDYLYETYKSAEKVALVTCNGQNGVINFSDSDINEG